MSLRPILGFLCMLATADLGRTNSPGETAPSFHFERLGPYGGDVRALLINPLKPSIVYLGTSDGHLYKSENGGNSWKILLPGIGHRQYVIDTLVHHPSDPDLIFAGAWDLRSSGGGLFESRDGGAHWRAVRLPKEETAVRDLAICRRKPSSMVAGTLNGVYVTDDGGQSWREVGGRGFPNVESVAIDPENPRILYVGTWRLSYRTLDAGKTWRKAGAGMPLDSHVFSVSLDPKNPKTMYAGACTGIFRSLNRAFSWRRLRVLPGRLAMRARAVLVDPLDPSKIYGGTTEGLYISRDRGLTWKLETSSHLTINSIQVDPSSNRKVLIGTDDRGVLRSDDGGSSWKDSNQGFVFRQISSLLIDPASRRTLLAGVSSDGQQGGFYGLEGIGGAWKAVTSEIVTKVSEIHCLLPLINAEGRLAGTSEGIYWQRSGRSIWARLQGSIAARAVYALVQDPGGRILAGTNDGVYEARESPLRFRKIPGSAISPKILTLAASDYPRKTLYVGTSTGVYRSFNQGGTWEWISAGLPTPVIVECLALCPAEPEHLLAGTTAGLFESANGGQSWQKANDGRLGVSVPSVVFLDSTGRRIAAADNAYGGIFLSEDGGGSWSRLRDPAFASPVRALAPDPAEASIVFLGTNSEGVYRLKLHARSGQTSFYPFEKSRKK